MDSPVDNSVTCETVKKFCSGHVRIWKTPKLESVPPYAFRRESELLVDQPNLILYQGMDLLARSLVGEKDAKIWGMYVGYQNNAVVTMPTIDRAYSTPFSSYEGQYGYLRIPLSIPPTYMATENYNGNIPLFTIAVSAIDKYGGVDFISGTSMVFELALIAYSQALGDTVFARTNFTPFKYDSSFNLGCSWGIKFLAS